MSAITGIFRMDGLDVDPSDIQKMNEKLSHRGPDGSRVWYQGPIALGHQMLHTTPESLHEELPFEDNKSGLVIVADARIDNRTELAEKLGITNDEYTSDSYFILKSFEMWGDKCAEKLLGDFAFVIWDKTNEKLFCARDHMGIKQFYYHQTKNALYFATEIKAILTIPEIPKQLNELKLAQFLTINTTDKLNTFYDDIIKLLPAHSLSIDKNNTELKKYWELDPDFQIKMNSDEEYFAAFRDIFAEAIKCRSRCAFQVGFELSGGLDSSSVVCMARNLINKDNINLKNINTYSYVFNDFPEVDERFFINKVIDGGQIESHFVYGDNITPLDQLDEILWYQEQPFFTPNMSIIWKSRQKMKEDNIRVLLSGDGGDEVISSGILFLQELALKFRWHKLFREIRAIKNNRNKGFLDLTIYYLILPFIPEIIKRWFSREKGNIFSENGTFILNKNFANRVGGEEYLHELKWGSLNKTNTAKEFHYLTLILDPYVLEMNDKMAAAFSIEQRYPYFDKRLIEFCYSIPSEMKFKSGWGRFIQRFALNGILPPEIQWRTTKTNFNPVYEKNLFAKEEIIEKIIYQEECLGKYLDLDKIREIYEESESKIKQGNDKFAVWLSLLIYNWLKMK